jgi:hypothetical protein
MTSDAPYRAVSRLCHRSIWTILDAMKQRASMHLGLLLVALLAAGASGCVVHAHPTDGPPPPMYTEVEYRPGYVFIEGRWVWSYGRWNWNDGYWIRERPGYTYVQGRWDRRGSRHVWVQGSWSRGPSRHYRVRDNDRYYGGRARVRGSAGVRVRDHRSAPAPRGVKVRDHRDDKNKKRGVRVRDHRR